MATPKTKDPRGAHVRLYHDTSDSNSWRCLTSGDQRVYLALTRGLMSFNNGDLSLTLKMAKPHGITSPTTLAKSLRALCAVGLIAVTREGGSRRDGERMPTLYRLTDYPVFAMPGKFVEACKATNEWKQIRTLGQGIALIEAAERAAKAEWAEKRVCNAETLHQKMDATTPKNGQYPPATTPKNGRCHSNLDQKMDGAQLPKHPARQALARVAA